MMDKSKLKSFSELRGLRSTLKREAVIKSVPITHKPKSKVQLMEVNNQYKIVQTPLKSLIKDLMVDRRVRSIQSIQDHLKEYEYKDEEVSTALTVLCIEGILVKEEVVPGDSNTNLYQYKSEIYEGYKPRKFKQEEWVDLRKSKDMIQSTDDLDTAIFKCMNDFKERTIDQIAGILLEHGMNQVLVKNRVVTLQRRKIFFDRIERHKKVYLRLKKHVKSFNEVVDNQKEEEEEMSNLIGMTPSQAMSFPLPNLNDSNKGLDKVITGPKKEEVNSTECVVENGDHLKLVIWKIMKDYEYYSVADIKLLVQEYGFKPGTISFAINSCKHDDNWFDIIKKPSQDTNRVVEHYRLKRKVTAPTKVNHPRVVVAVVKDIEPVTVKNTNVEDNVNTQPKTLNQDISEKTLSPLSPYPTSGFKSSSQIFDMEDAPKFLNVAQPTPLIQYNVKIKDIDFTLEELKVINDQLKDIGDSLIRFGSGLVKQTIRIKGVEFNSLEIQQLIKELTEINF